jgi:cysteine synthase A
MVCAQKGYPLVVTMAESFSVERRKLMRFLGARVILTPAADKGTGMLAKAKELAEQHGWFLCHQFENEANPDIHSRTTAEEILADFGPDGLDYWVSGLGTGGTLKGVSRVLKAKSPQTVIVAAEPDNSPLISSGIIQTYNDDGTPALSQPGFRPHLMQGWTPDFIPKLAQDVIDAGHIDHIELVNGGEAMRLSRELATKEGIFCGITGGATFAAALAVARNAPKGSRILAMIPDTGERYLSTPLFESIGADMSEEELFISDSTPSHRFHGKSAAAPAPVAVAEPTPAAAEFVEMATNDKNNPIVLFALEWCEFCWSVRRLFKAMDVTYRSVDLDSVEYQKDNWGGEIRVALRKATGAPTIPQIFVGGKHIGGCTETLDAFNDGSLQALLKANRVSFDANKGLDAYTLLPNWLHPRKT